ncbi:MAG: glycosyl transferase [Clostridia bacterium]|nr:glycosyl transferase [Clostridia bacterium]
MLKEYVARGASIKPEDILKREFQSLLQDGWVLDALYVDSCFDRVIGVANLPVKAPVMLELLKNREAAEYLLKAAGKKASVLIVNNGETNNIGIYVKEGTAVQVDPPKGLLQQIIDTLASANKWAGELNAHGEHIVDLRTPSPGPHFNVNLLMGNRVGFDHALQTTPKSVVDKLGRGSFRSHAATQVLATRWDMRQEENGFPANRQFYLVENCKKIFYSADANDSNIESATCIHSQNYTTIQYKTKCGLEIKRVIFILPQKKGLPLATEVQQIIIKNNGSQPRDLKLVYTGMFGTASPHALFEDVLYSNVIMQTRILKNEDDTIAAISPDYYPEQGREDIRFHTMMIKKSGAATFAKEFCGNYNEFVGSGTLENPEGVANLSNNFYRKGPGFFALAGEISVQPGETCQVDNFTGLVSKKVNPEFNHDTLKAEIINLIDAYSKPGSVEKALEENKQFYDRYRNFIELQSSDDALNTYFNKNLPFQVLYQTFVSRSFCQTQKGYREIGFREIQDIYATMYYFVSMGMVDFVKQLLKEWCSKVFEFGFAYHNFFWEGKEPGKWSDDALWFIQATYRYINLSGDIGFLNEECEIAGTKPVKTRPIYETIKAILRYSGEISVGKHGIPLLDNADWNDCLKLDNDFIDGITKEKRYREQIEKGGRFGDPFISDYSESIMNGFLLKLAIDQTKYLAKEKGDQSYAQNLEEMSQKLYGNLQEHAWKGDFFARVLFNRYKNNEYTYLGAKGDGLSADPNIDGSYFLNSFNWAVLSDSATEEQIGIMLDTIEKYLKTPYGLKLVTLTDLGKVANDTATGHYFPGDRENGAVFKHATMMATSAMLKAAKEVKDKELAARLGRMAYWMVDLVAPYKTMKNPFVTCGNPRFCTQYNNSETGENIGPMLSGTSTWLILTLMSALGVEYTRQGIILDPVMKENETSIRFRVNSGKAVYNILVQKPEGFYRVSDGNVKIMVDGTEINSNVLPLFEDNKEHKVEMIFQ